LLGFALTRIVLGLLFVVGVTITAQVGIDLSLAALGLKGNLFLMLPKALFLAALACLAYAGFVRITECRPVWELGSSGSVWEFLLGLAIGAGLFACTIGSLAALGCYTVAGTNSWEDLLKPLAAALAAGFFEEVLARGIVFRILEQWLGTWLALASSALLFGFAHAFNPGATPYSSLAITVEAGLLLGCAFMWTRRLWLPIGIHAAWNFTQGGIFGVAVSGNESQGLLQGELQGPPWLTGGAFGAEASVFALVFCTAAAIVLCVLALRAGHYVRPFWARVRPA
jgi:membrane protease YdiL (CAAX protease family)